MQTYYLTVSGVASSKRMNKVAEVLNTLPGVGAATVSPLDGEFTIHFNERHTSVGELTSAVEEAGYRIDNAGPTHRAARAVAASSYDRPAQFRDAKAGELCLERRIGIADSMVAGWYG